MLYLFLFSLLLINSRKTNSSLISFINASPHNNWILRSTGDSIDYMMMHYQESLAPGATEVVELSNNTVKNFIYEVCDSSGSEAILYMNGPGLKCAIYSGALINLTIASNNITAQSIGNNEIKRLTVTGTTSPYLINATTTPQVACELPYAMTYNDKKLRIINLEGATLDTPQIPDVCDLLYFANTGVNSVALPFKWDYLQNFLGQDIAINWSNDGYGGQLLYLIKTWTDKNYTVIFSMYDHMRYSYCSIGASDCWVNEERYANAWQQIAKQLANNSRVIFGLMNNPDVYDLIEGRNNGTRIVLNNQNAAAKAIREAGATTQLILYSGNGGSNIQNWFAPYDDIPNAEMFTRDNIHDHHYQLDIEMFYENPKTSPEQGCLTSALEHPQACIDKQNPNNFTAWLAETESYVIIKKTGGTNSNACIICINQGTAWMMLQDNILGIGMWVGGHAWLTRNGSTNYALYLAPIHNIAQKQMTLGFQNVSNSKTGEQFLVSLNPSVMPTPIPSIRTPDKSAFDWQFFSITFAVGSAVLASLYMLYRHYKKPNISNKRTHYFFAKEKSLLGATLLNKTCNMKEMTNVV